MADSAEMSRYLDGEIEMTHERLIAAMNSRRGEMELEEKERYFATISVLVRFLEDREKPLRRVLKDAWPEIWPHISAELNRR